MSAPKPVLRIPSEALTGQERAEIRRRLDEHPLRYAGDPEGARLHVLRLLNDLERCEDDVGCGDFEVEFVPDPKLLHPNGDRGIR